MVGLACAIITATNGSFFFSFFFSFLFFFPFFFLFRFFFFSLFFFIQVCPHCVRCLKNFHLVKQRRKVLLYCNLYSFIQTNPYNNAPLSFPSPILLALFGNASFWLNCIRSSACERSPRIKLIRCISIRITCFPLSYPFETKFAKKHSM